ncbi:MAG: DUF1294 domain-containing protein [Candidatus Falkowbacteria bacterium]|nr:MAG: DUF1294 domain-containing protein [Candidatus Falkowbacteria bacterium]
MNNTLLLILAFLLATNLIVFFLMFLDKLKSANPGSSRISEGLLFFLGSAFGALGVYLGMFVFRHKTRKWYFLIGIPLLFLQNLAAAWLIYLYLLNK